MGFPTQALIAELAHRSGFEEVSTAVWLDSEVYLSILGALWPAEERAVRQALAFFEEGKGYALDRPPKYGIDLGGADWSSVVHDGKLVVSIQAPSMGPKRGTTQGFGFSSAGNTLVQSVGTEATDAALLLFVQRNTAPIKEYVVNRMSLHRGFEAVGFEAVGLDAADFDYAVTRVNMVFGDTVHVTPWSRGVPVQIHAEIAFQPKEAVTTTPLVDLSNADLDSLIKELVEPEALGGSGKLAFFRKEFRAYSPRRQTELYAEYLQGE